METNESGKIWTEVYNFFFFSNFTWSTFQLLSYKVPILRTIKSHKFLQLGIFCRPPMPSCTKLWLPTICFPATYHIFIRVLFMWWVSIVIYSLIVLSKSITAIRDLNLRNSITASMIVCHERKTPSEPPVFHFMRRRGRCCHSKVGTKRERTNVCINHPHWRARRGRGRRGSTRRVTSKDISAVIIWCCI